MQIQMLLTDLVQVYFPPSTHSSFPCHVKQSQMWNLQRKVFSSKKVLLCRNSFSDFPSEWIHCSVLTGFGLSFSSDDPHWPLVPCEPSLSFYHSYKGRSRASACFDRTPSNRTASDMRRLSLSHLGPLFVHLSGFKISSFPRQTISHWFILYLFPV